MNTFYITEEGKVVIYKAAALKLGAFYRKSTAPKENEVAMSKLVMDLALSGDEPKIRTELDLETVNDILKKSSYGDVCIADEGLRVVGQALAGSSKVDSLDKEELFEWYENNNDEINRAIHQESTEIELLLYKKYVDILIRWFKRRIILENQIPDELIPGLCYFYKQAFNERIHK